MNPSQMTEHSSTTDQNLYSSVKSAVEKYLANLAGEPVNELYDIVLAEIERPFFEVVLKYTKGNQSKAAILLGLSRGTLRKKLKELGFLD
jgi:Fis family transcriptional regulator